MPAGNNNIDSFTLFGVRVSLTSERSSASSSLRRQFAEWDKPELAAGTASVYIAIRGYDVNEGNLSAAANLDTAPGVKPSSLAISEDGITIVADGECGIGACMHPMDHDEGGKLQGLLKTLVLFLVAQAGRIPLHASAVVHNGVALVFAGRSGSGKSSLALSANRTGLPILSEDTVYIEYAPRFRIWGMPAAIHLLEARSSGADPLAMRYRSGRWKHAFPVAAKAHMAGRAALCVLERGRDVKLQRMSMEDAVTELTQAPEPGYGFYGARLADSVRAIGRDGCWKLSLSQDPDAAVAMVLSALPQMLAPLGV